MDHARRAEFPRERGQLTPGPSDKNVGSRNEIDDSVGTLPTGQHVRLEGSSGSGSS